MIATLERHIQPVTEQELANSPDHTDQLWDGHGLLMAMLLVLGLVLVSIVAIIGLNMCAKEKPAATSAMLIMARDFGSK